MIAAGQRATGEPPRPKLFAVRPVECLAEAIHGVDRYAGGGVSEV